jgi:hypothetical protein
MISLSPSRQILRSHLKLGHDFFHIISVLPSGKEPPPPVLLHRKLLGPQNRAGRYGERKNLAPARH